MVKVRYDEGVTNHIGPESCEGVREALTEVRAGQAIERRKFILRDHAGCGQWCSCKLHHCRERKDYTSANVHPTRLRHRV